MTTTQTALQPPYYLKSTASGQGLIVHEGTGHTVAIVYDDQNGPDIVTACNAHDDLLALAHMVAQLRKATGKESAEIGAGMLAHLVDSACAAIHKAGGEA